MANLHVSCFDSRMSCDHNSLTKKLQFMASWCNGCNGRKSGMRVSPFSDQSHQRAGSRPSPPENLVSTVSRTVRRDLDLE